MPIRAAQHSTAGWRWRPPSTGSTGTTAHCKNPYDPTLAALLAEPSFQALVGRTLAVKARFVKDTGNAAVHGKPVSAGQAAGSLREFFHIAYWLARTYARGAKPPADAAFRIEALPRVAQVAGDDTRATAGGRAVASRRRSRRGEAAEAARRVSEEGRAALEAEIKALQARDRRRQGREPGGRRHPRLSRGRDPRPLHRPPAARGRLRPEGARHNRGRSQGMPNAPGVGYVDYVLRGDDGKPLALVEAKRTRKDPRVGQQQAKLYADCLEAQYGQRPIIFYTNGYDHWIWDDTRHPPRPIQGFLKKDELALMIQRRETRKALAPEDIDRNIVERFYQQRAIRRVAEAFERDKQRKALLVMATGAGKTRTVIALCRPLDAGELGQARAVPRRPKALVKQAVNAFKTHLPGAATVNLLEDKTQEGRVYVSTYPTMMGLIDEADAGERRFGVGHFDLVVIDEAHRSVYRKYKAIFEYFDSLLVGLTATPKGEVDRDTYRLFDLQTGVPTDAYDARRGGEGRIPGAAQGGVAHHRFPRPRHPL